MIEGLSHITFIVKDLERMKLLLVGALGGKEVYDSGGKSFSISREKFFEVGGVWIVVMGGGNPLAEQTYNHVAFKVPHDDLPRYRAAIENLGCRSVSRVRGSRGKDSRFTSTISTITCLNCIQPRSPSGLRPMRKRIIVSGAGHPTGAAWI
jgi:catechol 2,3-dioxygenase-like lactoylglutathione lyase family enzyme